MTNTPSAGDQGPADERSGVPSVIFLHGRGSNEQSAGIVSEVFAGASILAPRGPLREGPGYAWFRNHSPGVAQKTSLVENVVLTEAWIDSHAPSSDLWLCGFSNGAAMAAALLLSRPSRYSGALLVSGPLVTEHPWPPGRLDGIPILLVYGQDDQMIPSGLMTATAAYLDGPSGARASVVTVSGGHEISQRAFDVMKEWFTMQKKGSRRSAPFSSPHPEIV